MPALIFDFDGLIIDTETPEVLVWREIFAEHGCTFPDSWWMNAIGRGADQIVESPYTLLGRLAGCAVDEVRLSEERHRRVMERINGEPIRPGVAELLEDAKSAGWRTGVASSSRHDWVDGHLERVRLLEAFDSTTCADDVPRAKPYPDLYLEACRRLGARVEDAIALEDSPNGIRAAREAGVFVVVVPNEMTRQMDVGHADARLETLQGVTVEDLLRLRRSG